MLIVGVTSAAPAAMGLKARLRTYRRCVEVRSILSPRILAPEGERTVGAAVDCARHHGHMLETVTAPAERVPRVPRSKAVTNAVTRLLHKDR